MIQIIVSKVLPVFTVVVTPVLAIVLHVASVLLPVFSSCGHPIAQIAAPIVECLRTIGDTILKPGTLIGKTRSCGSTSETWQGRSWPIAGNADIDTISNTDTRSSSGDG